MLAKELLRCAACKSGFLPPPGATETAVRCEACSTSYPVRDGVIDLLPASGSLSRTLAQAAMEWPPIVRIYESRLWRRSPLTSFALGLSFDRERQLILRELSLQGAETVLDLACGPGIYSRAIARQVLEGQVVGLDLSLPMLAYATRRARAEGIGNVLWVHGDAMDLPFADGRLDAVNCCGALHLFPDLSHVLSEIRRVLGRNGRFTAATGRRAEGLEGELAVRLVRRAGVSPITEAGLRARLIEAGFADVQCLHARRAWMIWSARITSVGRRAR